MIWAGASRGLCIALACAGVAALHTTSASGAAARAASTRCTIPGNGEHLGPTYLNALSVVGATCSTGLGVVRAYHACQLTHGGVTARCNSPVDGFRCREMRGPSIATEFYSSVTCVDRAERVIYKYSQFT
jgi:hypothetical protein